MLILDGRHGLGGCDGIVRQVTILTGSSRIDTKYVGSDYSGSPSKLPKILLNGNNVCMVCYHLANQRSMDWVMTE